MKKNILQKIFIEHYEEIKYSLHPRDSIMDNIDKMINCGDPSFGGATCMAALNAESSNLFLSAAKAVSALPVAINTPWSVQTPCPLKSLV